MIGINRKDQKIFVTGNFIATKQRSSKQVMNGCITNVCNLFEIKKQVYDRDLFFYPTNSAYRLRCSLVFQMALRLELRLMVEY